MIVHNEEGGMRCGRFATTTFIYMGKVCGPGKARAIQVTLKL
jgi:hypothetical protein